MSTPVSGEWCPDTKRHSRPLTCDVGPGLPAAWPTLAAGGSLFATPGWLRAMEGRLGPRPVTIVVRRGGVPTLAAYGCVQERHRPGELFDLHHALVHPAADLPLAPRSRELRAGLESVAPPPPRWSPSLVIMLPGYDGTPVGPDAGDRAATSALVDAALRWAAERGIATVAWLYLRPQGGALAAALAGRGFVRVPLMPTWDLPLPGTGMADYFAALPHKRRIEARRELRLLADAGVRIEPVPAGEVVDVFDELVRLRCQLVAKYRATWNPAVEREKLRRVVVDVAGGRPLVLLARAGGRDAAPLGFAMFTEHGGRWHCLGVGFDYENPRSRLTYFGTAYYRAAELAYEHGIPTIGYGLGAWRAKRARGCRATPLGGWVHSTDPQLSAALQATSLVTELVDLT